MDKLKRLCIWEVSSQCNEICKMCNIHNRTTPDCERFKTIEDINYGIGFIKKQGVTDVYVQGGEPLIHNKINVILKRLVEEGLNVRIITNAVKLDNKMIDFLINLKIGLTVSLDTLKPDIYTLIRGTNRLESVLRNLEIIRKREINGLYWGIHSVITKININEIMSIKKYAEELNMDYSAFPLIGEVGNAGLSDNDLSNDDKKVVQILNQLLNEEKDEISKEEYKIAIQCVQGIMCGTCDAFNYSFVLDEKGNIKPCIERDFEWNIFDNDTDLKKVFESPPFDCKYHNSCFYGGSRTYGIIARLGGAG